MLKIRQKFGNQAKIWRSGKILKIGKIFEKCWESGKILKIGQKFENGSILKILSARHFPNKIFPKKSARHLHMQRVRALLSKISGTSARHLQMTRARNLRVDTRGLPEANKTTAVSYIINKLSCNLHSLLVFKNNVR